MTERLDDATIEAAMLDLEAWAREGETISRSFDCANFDGSIAFVNAVARAANAADHHPDIAISWNDVTLTLSTHSAGGLTRKDFDLARTLDALAQAPPS